MLLAPLVTCLLIAVPDSLFDRVPPLITLLLIGPLLAGARLGVRHTVVCCWSAVLAWPWVWRRRGAEHRLRHPLGGLLVGCALTVYAARQRDRLRELLARAHEVAGSPQTAILRPISRTFDGTRVCTRYHSVPHESAVGGDLYDVAVTPYGLRVVGDVRGHGVEGLRLAADTITAFRDLSTPHPT